MRSKWLISALALAGAAAADTGGVPRPVVRQWAAKASASTEYSNPRWAASQATGPPNTAAAGDHDTAWAPREEDGGEEWLELRYAKPVVPTLIRIHETFNPGAVVKVEAGDERGSWKVIWQGRAAAPEEKIRWFEVKPARRVATFTLRLTLDSNAVPGWNEIDAVELIGRP
jgi:hypothetical protein